jgi:uncharacterized membrane-anchored protein
MVNEANSNLKKSRQLLNKVPEITIFFWVIKILTTGMGEVTSDFFVLHFDPVITVIIAGLMLVITLVVQISAKRYKAYLYWFTVVMVSVFGTMSADVLHVVLGIPYTISTTFFVISLAIIFILWYKTEKTLSIHSIYTKRRELFYWATILATFALGTATGDMTATTMHLGYFMSGVMFAIIILIPAIAYWKFGVSEIFTFWFAYIITRPLGASFADWMGVEKYRGGLGIGTGPVSLVLGVIIVIFVGFMTISKIDVKKD